jgi:hypothetical protein
LSRFHKSLVGYSDTSSTREWIKLRTNTSLFLRISQVNLVQFSRLFCDLLPWFSACQAPLAFQVQKIQSNHALGPPLIDLLGPLVSATHTG